MLFDIDRKQWSELATGNQLEYPNWSRDGQFIFIENAGDNGQELIRVNVKKRARELVLSLKGIPRADVAFGAAWSGIAPDGSFLLMRDTGTREIYALTVDLP